MACLCFWRGRGGGGGERGVNVGISRSTRGGVAAASELTELSWGMSLE